jgi:hypothetical protein
MAGIKVDKVRRAEKAGEVLQVNVGLDESTERASEAFDYEFTCALNTHSRISKGNLHKTQQNNCTFSSTLVGSYPSCHFCFCSGQSDFSVPELPDLPKDFGIGLIVGPSGSGKTSILRKSFGYKSSRFSLGDDRPVQDFFKGTEDRHRLQVIWTELLLCIGMCI